MCQIFLLLIEQRRFSDLQIGLKLNLKKKKSEKNVAFVCLI